MIGLVVTGQESESFSSGRALSGSVVDVLLSAGRSSALKFLVLAFIVAGVVPCASPQGMAEGQADRRYLFVVETSRAMQRRAQGVHDTLKALLDSNLNGQMRPGDSIAIWTFNETISTNFFSTAPWSPAARASLGARLPDFLDASTYEKRALLDKLIARLESQVAMDGLLTVILVTTGEEDVQGTPFDNQLRRAFSQWRPDQQRARMPILTLLRGSHGRFSQWSVNAAPWPLEIPSLDAVVQSSQPNPNEALKTNRSATTGTPVRTNSPAPGNPQTNAVLAPTNMTNAFPLMAKTNIVAATNQVAATAAITNTNAASNAVPTAASPSETNGPSIAVRHSPPLPDAAAKTNMVTLAGDPPATGASGGSEPPEHPPAIAFSADAPRREETTSVPAAISRQDDQAAAISAAQSNSAVSPPTNAPSSAQAPTPNLIPPLDPPASKSTQIAMTEPVPHSFFHENAKWIVAACISGIFAIFCTLLWLSTYSRNQLNLATLPKNKKAER